MPAPSAEHRLAHVLRHLDAVCSVPAAARPGYDGLAPVRLPAPTSAAIAFFRGSDPLPPETADVHWLHIGHDRAPVLFEGDLIGSIFFWLSGWQEVHSTARDQFGRFPYAASLQARLGCIGLPVADMLLEALRTWLEHESGHSIPRNHPLPPLAVSHDIDHLRGGWRVLARYHWSRREVWQAVRATVHHVLGRHDPFDNLQMLAQIVRDETGLASTFYFLGERGKHAMGHNGDYTLLTPRIQRQIQQLETMGCSVGLHGSFGTSDDAELLRAELQKLPHMVAGVRFHYLRFDPVSTPEVLMKAGAAYDATLGFAERAGFRHGTAHPFWLYDFEHQRSHRVVCYPLHAMDVTFANPAYQPTPAPDIPGQVAELARAAALCGGTLQLLWHNEYIVKGEETLGEHTLREVLRQAAGMRR